MKGVSGSEAQLSLSLEEDFYWSRAECDVKAVQKGVSGAGA